MAYITAVAGKGGVGKTTISSLLIQHLAKIKSPVLAIDADPNSNLNILLGFDYENTISDIREETRSSSSTNFSKSDLFNMLLHQTLVEGEGVDLLVMGRPEGPGCYCAVNNILREYLSKLSKSYKFVVIDNEAGMEHLSRRTANNIDKLLLISDPTMVSVQSAINAFNTAKKAGLKVYDISLLINKSKKELEEEKIKLIQKSGLIIDGYIPFKEEIEKQSEKGEKISNINTNDLEHIFNTIIKIEGRYGKNNRKMAG